MNVIYMNCGVKIYMKVDYRRYRDIYIYIYFFFFQAGLDEQLCVAFTFIQPHNISDGNFTVRCIFSLRTDI